MSRSYTAPSGFVPGAFHHLGELIHRYMTGILGTVLFHLVVITAILTIKLNSKVDYPSKDIVVELDQEVKPEEPEKTEQMKANEPDIEKMAEGVIGRNIAVSADEKIKNEISTDKYIQDLEKQMDLPGFKALQEGNRQAIAPSKASEDKTDESVNIQQETPKETPKDKVQGNTIYRGPTTIIFSLPGRRQRYIAVPVYKCEGSGDVVTEIFVDQEGTVVSATVVRDKSSAMDECLYEAAEKYALRSLFNADPKAPPRQKGTIRYHFVAQ